MPVFNPENGMMVPDTLFYENPQVSRENFKPFSHFPQCTIPRDSGMLRIGHTTMPVFNPENGMMVPDTLFYENALVSTWLNLSFYGESDW